MKPSGYYEHDRPEILEAIPLDAARVLDVGCGSGRLGEQIKQRQSARVWGIEVVREVAERAAQRLDRVWNTTVEEALDQIPERTFDCIITADVLEHLVDPWTVLAELGRKLAPEGAIVASIPNIGHWDIIRDLIEGTWRYTSEGLLDRTHLRFFTRRSVQELFWTAGLAIRELTTIPAGSEVPAPVVTALRGAGLSVEGLAHDGQVFQYRVVAEKRKVPTAWPLVGIVILSGNRKSDTLQCLESIRHLDYAPVDTVVVDTGSTEGSTNATPVRLPATMILETGRTHASLADINPGIQCVLERGAEYVLILSSEMVVDQAFLARLMETAVLTPEAGLWGPQICYKSRPNIVWGTGLNWHQGQRNFVMQGTGEAVADSVHMVDALTGCAMLIRSDVFERVGLFAPEYLLSWGEIDFCTRAVKQGFKCLVVPASLMWHTPEASSGEERSLVREYFNTRNRLLWERLHLRQFRNLRPRTLQELWSILPRMSGSVRGLRGFYWWVFAAAREFQDPIVRMRARALFDHLVRRSGDCPRRVRRSADLDQRSVDR